MVSKIKAWYGSLPTWAQGAVTAAEGGALGFLAEFARSWVNGTPLCFSGPCLKGFAIGLATAAAIALRNWFKQSPIKAVAALQTANAVISGGQSSAPGAPRP